MTRYVSIGIKDGKLEFVLGFEDFNEAVEFAKMQIDCDYVGIWELEDGITAICRWIWCRGIMKKVT